MELQKELSREISNEIDKEIDQEIEKELRMEFENPPEKEQKPEKKKQIPNEKKAPPTYQETIKERSDFPSFRSYRYSLLEEDVPVNSNHLKDPEFMPNVTEAIAHLRLLRAFGELKRKVVLNFKNSNEESGSDWIWKLFVTVAVRRFILFISAVKLHANKLPSGKRKLESTTDSRSQKMTTLLNRLVPPWDVLMVWHSFMLNPMTFYDVFARKDMYYFVNYPFPLHIIDTHINGETFDYVASVESKRDYLTFLAEFTTNAQDLQYDPDLCTFYEQLVVFYSPNTHKAMTGPVPLTTSNGTGFADRKFKTKSLGYRLNVLNEQYGDLYYISFDELRKVILDYDLQSPRLLEGILKNYSNTLCSPMFKNRDPERISYHLARDLINVSRRPVDSPALKSCEPCLQELLVRLTSGKSNRSTVQSLILRPYLRFNLISLTVCKGVNIGEDLVDCVFRQGRFIEKMNSMDWLHSPVIKEGLMDSLSRYHRFFLLLTDATTERMLVPTLDIDLMWHTHQLMLYGYIRDCKSSPCQSVIDHNDKVEKMPLDDGFEATTKLYKERYNEDYSVCFCNDCISKRTGKLSKIANIFKLLKKSKPWLSAESNPLFLKEGEEGVTHSSEDCSVSKLVLCSGKAGNCCKVERDVSKNGIAVDGVFRGGFYVFTDCAGGLGVDPRYYRCMANQVASCTGVCTGHGYYSKRKHEIRGTYAFGFGGGGTGCGGGGGGGGGGGF